MLFIVWNLLLSGLKYWFTLKIFSRASAFLTEMKSHSQSFAPRAYEYSTISCISKKVVLKMPILLAQMPSNDELYTIHIIICMVYTYLGQIVNNNLQVRRRRQLLLGKYQCCLSQSRHDLQCQVNCTGFGHMIQPNLPINKVHYSPSYPAFF